MDDNQSVGGHYQFWFNLSLLPGANVGNQSYAVDKLDVTKSTTLLKKSLAAPQVGTPIGGVHVHLFSPDYACPRFTGLKIAVRYICSCMWSPSILHREKPHKN